MELETLDTRSKKERAIQEFVEKFPGSKLINENQFGYEFRGPPNSLYAKGCWFVVVTLSDRYPKEPPGIHFDNKIFHPNISLAGKVSEGLFKRHYYPKYDLEHIFTINLKNILNSPDLTPKYVENPRACEVFRKGRLKYEKFVNMYISDYASEKDISMETSSFDNATASTSSEQRKETNDEEQENVTTNDNLEPEHCIYTRIFRDYIYPCFVSNWFKIIIIVFCVVLLIIMCIIVKTMCS